MNEPLVLTIAVPCSLKARQTVLAWANTWQTTQSRALRSIYRRGLNAAQRRGNLPDYPNDYEAKCTFRLPNYLLSMTEAWLDRYPDWQTTHVQRAVLYLGLLAVQADGLQDDPIRTPVARNRERATEPA